VSRAALLDVNFLIALFDPDHVHHEAAHAWFSSERGSGWATCPLTENGVVRILSNPAYSPSAERPAEIAARLAAFRASGDHAFWPDDVSICDAKLFRLGIGHRQLTDAYLLALAVRRSGRLATFDRSIPTKAVHGARSEHLVVVDA
jgi:toxin-antitoxin system PIN domain toxin